MPLSPKQDVWHINGQRWAITQEAGLIWSHWVARNGKRTLKAGDRYALKAEIRKATK